MADEASIRIIVQDEGRVNTGNAQGPQPSAPNPNPYAPPPANQYTATPPPRVAGPTPAQLPTQRFDPVAEASKMREAEIRREMVKATYDRLYDTADKTKSALDAMLDVALKMRGTLGGAFGGLVGTALDAYAVYKDRQKSSVRIEAERRLGFASGGEIPSAPGVPLNADEVPIKATAGEFVVNKAAAQIPENRAILDEMNSKNKPVSYGDVDIEKEYANITGEGVFSDKQQKRVDYFWRMAQKTIGGVRVDPQSSKDYSSGKILVGGKEVYLDLDPKRKNFNIGFNDANQAAFSQSDTLQPGSIDFMRSLKDFVSNLGDKGFGVDFSAEPRRNKLYEKMLSRAGFERQDSSWRKPKEEHHAMGGSVGGHNVAKHYASGGSVGGAGSAAMMAVAPELALAIQAAKAIEDSVHSAVSGASSLASTAISPDANAAKSVMDLGDTIKNTFGGLIGIVGETTSSFGRLMGTIDGVANRYAEFSPEISQAQGMAEVRQTMGDLRRAQEAGPELARYVQMQSEMQQKFEDIKIKVLLKILPIVELIGTLLGEAVSSGSDITSAVIAVATPLNALVAVAHMINGTMKDAEREEPQDPTNLLINLTTGVNGPGLNLPPPT